MEGFVTFEHVYKTYGSGEGEVHALKDASFTIDQGEIAVILGQSGAGKTTLLNILGGMDTLTSGKVFLEGKEVSALSRRELAHYRREEIGFVFQFYNLVPNLTALENVELAAQIVKDSIPAQEVLKLLQDQSRKNGMTVAIITHNSALAGMADRVIRVKSGTIRSVMKNENIVPVEEIEW